MTIAHTTYLDAEYRLSPDDRATNMRPVGLRETCRFTWSTLQEARGIRYSHASGRTIETPTFFTPGKDLKAMWDAIPKHGL